MKPANVNLTIFLLSLGFQFFSFYSNAAPTYAEKTLTQKNELILPQRLTVGPSDNFQTAISPDGNTIFYSSSTQLAIRIFRQDLDSNFSGSLIGDKTDSKDPVLSPDGSLLAFTSFQHDARGDICLYQLSDKKSRCLTGRDTEDRSPFWIDRSHIGYLSRKSIEEPYSVSIISTAGEGIPKPSVLFSGNVADPVCSPEIGGVRWIAYTRIQNQKSVIELRKVVSSKDGFSAADTISFSVDLPGFSSFPSFDAKGEFLYFGQYTIDTNGDLQVDARDKSALFRLPLKEVLNKNTVFPEPLTSIDYNCNYPEPTPFGLFMTCASPNLTGDGSLDIYSLPLSGMIPTHWEEQKLLRGVETARSYNDRTLLYYALISRFHQYRTPQILEKILSDYISDNQYSAAIFYSEEIGKTSKDPHFYKLLEILLEATMKSKQEGEGVLSSAFRAYIEGETRKSKTLQSSFDPSWSRVVEAQLLHLVGKNTESKARLQNVSVHSIKHPLVLYFYNQILDSLEKTSRLSRLEELSESKVLSESSKVFYAYQFLRETDLAYKNQSAQNRLQFLQKTKARLHEKASALPFLIDLDLSLARFKSDDVKDSTNQKVYGEVLNELAQAQSRYFLYRAMLVRSVLSLSERSYWNYMYFISSQWLNKSMTEDSEYSYARKQFLTVGLENAYGYWGTKQYSFAGDQFSITARLTDDLEAHHGFIRSRLQENRKREIDEMYQLLKKQGYIGDNLTYVSALLSLIEFQTSHPFETNEGLTQSLLKKLEGMSGPGFNPALRFYLMGYLSHKLFASELKRGGQNRQNFENAHRYYMLALDLSRDNERVVSNLLFNLGLLHQLAENHGQSLSFFDLRKQNIFEDQEEKAAFAWYYAKAYFYTLQPEKAFSTIANFLSEKDADKHYPEFLEKAGFYAAQAQDFSKAEHYYQSYFKSKLEGSEEADFVRSKVGYGYALFKLKKFKEAKPLFDEVMKTKSFRTPESFQPGRFLPLVHYQILALGFLAQMEDRPAQKLQLLSERLNLLSKQAENLNSVLMKQEDWLKTLATIRHQMAFLEFKIGSPERGMEDIEKSVGLLSEIKNLTGNPLDEVLVVGLTNYFAAVENLRSKQPNALPKDFSKAQKLAVSTHEAISQIPELKNANEYAGFEKLYLRFSQTKS